MTTTSSRSHTSHNMAATLSRLVSSGMCILIHSQIRVVRRLSYVACTYSCRILGISLQ